MVPLSELLRAVSATALPAISRGLQDNGHGHGTVTFLLVSISVVCNVLLLVHLAVKLMKPRVYLVDYSCAKGPDENKTTLETLFFFLKSMGSMSDRDIVFQSKVFLKSGIGEEAYMPREILDRGRGPLVEQQRVAEDQMQTLVVRSVDVVLKKTGVRPQEVDILVVNCGAFNPTPSLTSFLVNHLRMRGDVKSFHLSGMGCSAGLISLRLGLDLLQVHRRSARYAVVASTEFMVMPYDGKERSMMVTNCLFRSAGIALLLSNREEDKHRAKMEVIRVLRVNRARFDEAHQVIEVQEDEEGKWGARLSPQLIEVAGSALRENLEALAPSVLPVGELCRAGWKEVQRRMRRREGGPAFVADFKKAFEHICIHPGGKAVVEGVGKALGLSAYDVEPSAMALHRFGNTSSAGVWYALAYMEAKQRLKKGERVLQIGLGSGFKCNTAVLRVVRDVDAAAVDNPWSDCVHRYPVYQELSALPHIVPIILFFTKLLGVTPAQVVGGRK